MLDTGDLAQFLVLATILGFQPGGGGGGGVTYPIALNKGGTNTVLSVSPNSLVVGSSTGMDFLATANSGVVVTDSSGVPSVSTTLPSGLTIPGFLPIPTSLATNRLVVGNSASTMIGLVTPASAVLGSSSGGVPTWSTTLPSGLNIPGYPKTSAFAGNPNTNVAGTQGDFVVDTTTGNELWYCATTGTVSTATWTLASGGSGSGVTSITAGTGLSGGTITTTGTIALATIPTLTILANATGSSAVPTSVAIGSLLTFAGGVLNAVNQLATPVPLASGGTGTSVTSAPPGGIYFVNSAGMGTLVLSPTTPGWALVSGLNGGGGTSSAPSWTNYALPTTVTANGLLYATSSAALGQITTANNAIVLTDGSGVPGMATALPNAFVTYAQIQNVTAAKLLGNPTGTAAAPSEITIGSGLTLTGSTLSATGGGVSFPITLVQGGTNTDLSSATAHSLIYTTGTGGVATVPFSSSQGTFVRASAGAAGIEYSPYALPLTIASLNVGGLMYAVNTTSVAFASGGGTVSGFVVTNSSGIPTIVSALPANSVGLSSLAQIANATLLGNASGGTANIGTISIAGALTLTGGVLTNTSPTATGSGASGTWPISISGNAATASSSTTSTTASSVAANGVNTAAIQTSAVTYAKMQNMTTLTLLGNPTGSAAAPSEITLGSGLSFSGTTLSATGSGGITTLNGDTGSATGTTVTINALSNSGSSVTFVGATSTLSLKVTDALGNTIIGQASGRSGITGTANTSIGSGVFGSVTSGSTNTAMGTNAFSALTTGGSNVSLGATIFQSLLTGTNNIGIGVGIGAAYTGAESNNILINGVGVVGESNVLRISASGTGTKQVSSAFIGGIFGVTLSGAPSLVTSQSGDQLGTLGIGSGLTVSGGNLTATGSTSNALILADAVSTTNIAGTYNNGTAGVGATFTWSATGTQALDGQTVVLNGVYVLWFQSTGLQNGIYLCTTAPATGVNGVLTRATNYNTPALIQSNMMIKVKTGALWKGVILTCPTLSITIGTTSLFFTAMIFTSPTPTSSSTSAILTAGYNPGAPQFNSIAGAAGVFQSTGSVQSFSTTLPAALTIPQPSITGVITGSNATAGAVGEFISSVIPSSSSVSVTAGTATNVTSISLTAGDWDVFGNIAIDCTSITNAYMWSSTISASLIDNSLMTIIPGAANTFLGCPIPTTRLSLTTTTTVYLSTYINFTGTGTACGAIYARRRH